MHNLVVHKTITPCPKYEFWYFLHYPKKKDCISRIISRYHWKTYLSSKLLPRKTLQIFKYILYNCYIYSLIEELNFRKGFVSSWNNINPEKKCATTATPTFPPYQSRHIFNSTLKLILRRNQYSKITRYRVPYQHNGTAKSLSRLWCSAQQTIVDRISIFTTKIGACSTIVK